MKTAQGSDLVATLQEKATLVATLSNPDISLARAAATYLLYKRKRLTPASERGYRQILDQLTSRHPRAKLADFEPPHGALMIEDFLGGRWGHLEARTYNKALSVLSDLFAWHVKRGTLRRSPTDGIERAKVRQAARVTFTENQVDAILSANQDPRDQIALRLLLHFGIRKGALLTIRFEQFDLERRRLTVFTKGETIHTLPIVDETVWRLFNELAEPGHHYLLCRQKLRKRVSTDRQSFQEASDLLGDLAEVVVAIADTSCSREVIRLRSVIDEALELLGHAAREAAQQLRRYPDEPMGDHGAHDWWYRCLTRAGVVAPGTTSGRRMHGARHTSIQRVLDKTGNLKAAQTLAGHRNVATTGDIYSDWSEQLEGTMRDVLEVGR